MNKSMRSLRVAPVHGRRCTCHRCDTDGRKAAEERKNVENYRALQERAKKGA